jgi:hypothetical protein
MTARQALACVDRLDLYLFNMDELAAGRQPAIDFMKPTMVNGHEAVRQLWKALLVQL